MLSLTSQLQVFSPVDSSKHEKEGQGEGRDLLKLSEEAESPPLTSYNSSVANPRLQAPNQDIEDVKSGTYLLSKQRTTDVQSPVGQTGEAGLNELFMSEQSKDKKEKEAAEAQLPRLLSKLSTRQLSLIVTGAKQIPIEIAQLLSVLGKKDIYEVMRNEIEKREKEQRQKMLIKAISMEGMKYKMEKDLPRCMNGSRFELPIDYKSMEVMTPMDYLEQRCIVTEKQTEKMRQFLLQNDIKQIDPISYQNMLPALNLLYKSELPDPDLITNTLQFLQLPIVNNINNTNTRKVQHINNQNQPATNLRVVNSESMNSLKRDLNSQKEEILNQNEMSFKAFVGICTLLERLILEGTKQKYERLGVRGKLHTFDERDYIEIADFAGLESKLEQNNIPERTVQLLLLVKNIRRNCPFPLVEKERPYTFEDFRREHELQIQLNSAS
ncbi:uncharacterized protein LOC142353959 [Convolutriloba macropyga]|uniref:uncharacterized protein LOC142353959 n=1 Tax=Convolutriloba macropyga TaxID=536237 RepID=UPI003F51E6D9